MCLLTFAYCHHSVDVLSLIFSQLTIYLQIDPCYTNLGQAQTFQLLFQPVTISVSVILVHGHCGYLESSSPPNVGMSFISHVSCAVHVNPRVPCAQVGFWVITGCTSLFPTEAETTKLLSDAGVPLPLIYRTEHKVLSLLIFIYTLFPPT